MKLKNFIKEWRYFGTLTMLRYIKFKIICFFKFGTFSTHKASKKILEKEIEEMKRAFAAMFVANEDFCNALQGLCNVFGETAKKANNSLKWR